MKSGHAMLEDLGDSKPADTIAQLCQLPFLSQALYAVAKLGVADLLADGAKTDDELAQETNANAPSLYRVLRALCGLVSIAGLLPAGVPGPWDGQAALPWAPAP